MANRDKILTWLSIIAGGGVILAAIGAGLVFYVNYAVAEAFDNAKPASVLAVELDIALIKNDMSHMRIDVAENKEIAQDTNTIFREYLQDQTQ